MDLFGLSLRGSFNIVGLGLDRGLISLLFDCLSCYHLTLES